MHEFAEYLNQVMGMSRQRLEHEVKLKRSQLSRLEGEILRPKGEMRAESDPIPAEDVERLRISRAHLTLVERATTTFTERQKAKNERRSS